jgi:hypothetical protein
MSAGFVEGLEIFAARSVVSCTDCVTSNVRIGGWGLGDVGEGEGAYGNALLF